MTEDNIGPAGHRIRRAMFGMQSDTELQEQYRMTERGSQGADMIAAELRRRGAKVPILRTGPLAWLRGLFRRSR